MKENRYIVIMAGGIGSRFWPASKSTFPKQFLDILGTGSSLIQDTYRRISPLVPKENILISTNERYKDLVLQHLPDLAEQQLLLEPSRNNTAPSIAYAALKIKDLNPDAVFAVMPSDHIILNEQQFHNILEKAFEFANKEEAIVTLGIEPTRPDTGYGYIKKEQEVEPDIYKVEAFLEKPNKITAEAYLFSGDYLWNAGMFIWSVNTLISAFERYEPGILDILSKEPHIYNTEHESTYLQKWYPQTKKISVDFAILEKSQNVYTIPASIGWSDLGTWNSLFSHLNPEQKGNVVIGQSIHLNDCNQNIVRSDNSKTIVIKGLNDYIVVDEEDALLIFPKRDEQEIKHIVESLENS